jgi:hypothetical protein
MDLRLISCNIKDFELKWSFILRYCSPNGFAVREMGNQLHTEYSKNTIKNAQFMQSRASHESWHVCNVYVSTGNRKKTAGSKVIPITARSAVCG